MTVSSQVQYLSLIQSPSGGTQAQWEAIPAVVPSGLVVYAIDTTVVKIGDGTHAYVDLPVAATISAIFGIGPASTDIAGLVKLATIEEALAGELSDLAISPATMGHYVNQALGSFLVVTDGINTVNDPVRLLFDNGTQVEPVTATPPIIQSAHTIGNSISLALPVTVSSDIL